MIAIITVLSPGIVGRIKGNVTSKALRRAWHIAHALQMLADFMAWWIRWPPGYDGTGCLVTQCLMIRLLSLLVPSNKPRLVSQKGNSSMPQSSWLGCKPLGARAMIHLSGCAKAACVPQVLQAHWIHWIRGQSFLDQLKAFFCFGLPAELATSQITKEMSWNSTSKSGLQIQREVQVAHCYILFPMPLYNRCK